MRSGPVPAVAAAENSPTMWKLQAASPGSSDDKSVLATLNGALLRLSLLLQFWLQALLARCLSAFFAVNACAAESGSQNEELHACNISRLNMVSSCCQALGKRLIRELPTIPCHLIAALAK